MILNFIQEISWSYQFSQLKTSTDDNDQKVQFYFQDPLTKRIEVKVRFLKIKKKKKSLFKNDLYF